MTWLSRGAFRLVPAVLGRLPPELAAGLGRNVGSLARAPFGLRRDVAERQIRAAFPGRPSRWARSVARAAYRHFGRELVETLAVVAGGPGALLDRLENPGLLRRTMRAVGTGRGLVVVTGHIGNWELLGACAVAAERPVLAVARSQGALLDRELGALRGALGVEVVLEGSTARLPGALAAGAAVGLVADQHAGPLGVRVPFLGRPAATHLGPARLALLCEVPLLFGALLREGEGYRLVLDEVWRPGDASPDRPDPFEVTRRWVRRLEDLVRSRPEQYLWFHRRWKAGGRVWNGIPGPAVAERVPGPHGPVPGASDDERRVGSLSRG